MSTIASSSSDDSDAATCNVDNIEVTDGSNSDPSDKEEDTVVEEEHRNGNNAAAVETSTSRSDHWGDFDLSNLEFDDDNNDDHQPKDRDQELPRAVPEAVQIEDVNEDNLSRGGSIGDITQQDIQERGWLQDRGEPIAVEENMFRPEARSATELLQT